MTTISPQTVSRRLEMGDDQLLVLDVRHAGDYEDWHIPGSRNIDVIEELREDPAAAATALRELPEDREIVTVCAAGVLSQRATETLRDAGYEAKTLSDGMAGWSRVHRSAPVATDLPGTVVQVARPGTGCLSHVLVSDGEAAVFDPSRYLDEYDEVLGAYDADLVGVFDTHAHADHISGGGELADRHAVPYYLHPKDAADRDVTPLADGDRYRIGEVEIAVLHTPGHSPGSVSFVVEDEALLTGDTLFHESVGRVELGVEAGLETTDVEANAGTLYDSLQRLQDRPGDPLVLPAHDPGSPQPPVTAHLSEVVQRNSDLGLDRGDFITAIANDIPDHPANFERIKRVNVGLESLPEAELDELEVGPNNCAAG